MLGQINDSKEIANLKQAAIELLANGAIESEVIGYLTRKGLDNSTATLILRQAQLSPNAHPSPSKDIPAADSPISLSPGAREALFGLFVVITGIVISYLSYRFAADNNGGYYVVAVGAIIGGIWKIIKGLTQ